jgi:hypothetical protein
VPTKRASVRCVAKRFWIPKTTSKRLSRLIEVSGFLWFYFLLWILKTWHR